MSHLRKHLKFPSLPAHCAAFVDAPMKRDGANIENADEHDCARRKTRNPRQLGEAGHTETMIHKCKHHVDIAVITNNKRDEAKVHASCGKFAEEKEEANQFGVEAQPRPCQRQKQGSGKGEG